MTKVIGVRFRNVGKIYYFSPQDLEIKAGEHVIVETARGVEYGSVVLPPREVSDEKVVQPLKEVIRIATPQDDKKEEANRKREKEAFQICLKKIREHNLEMKLIDVEYTFDNNKILFYFTADGRVDFRELVKEELAENKERLEDGDLILLLTDGITDAFGGERQTAQWLEEKFLPQSFANPQDAADFILQAAQEHCQKEPDDMTVQAARFWKKIA